MTRYLTARRLARRLIVGIPGPELGAETRRQLLSLRPFGVILFAGNIISAPQLADLVAALRGLYRPRPFLFLDQEGGRVDRLRALLAPLPAAAVLGRAGPASALRAGECAGAALSHFGFDVDFAPVVDLQSAGKRPGLETRCFGGGVETVVSAAGAFLAGLHRAGIGGVLKHFPGLGAGKTDTHTGRAVIPMPLARLRQRETKPFAALADVAGAVMVGHAVYPHLTGRLPASLSARTIGGLLRRGLEFGGIVFCDDLDMWGAAVSPRTVQPADAPPLLDRGESAARALLAGCDILPFCHDLDTIPAALDTMRRRLERNPSRSSARLERAEAASAVYAQRLRQIRRLQSIDWEWDEIVREIEALNSALLRQPTM